MLITRWQIVGGFVILCCVSAVWAQPATPPDDGPGGRRGGFSGFGGFGGFPMPRPVEILPGFLRDQLKLTGAQKKKLGEMEKDVEANLTKLLTVDQKKSLDETLKGKGGPGFGAPGFAPPSGAKPGSAKPGGVAGGGMPPGGMPGSGFPKGGFGGMPGFGSGGFGTTDVRKKIGATEEEWKVIGPKVQKVTAARRALSGDSGSMFGLSGAGAGSNVVAQAQAELKAVLDEPKHTKAEVDEKIAAVRKAREKSRADLEEAQRDLARLLTADQQVIMVSLGHLD